jgi:hypothetical protein
MATDAETLADADALEAAAILNASLGISSVSVDGTSTSIPDPMKQLDIVDRLRNGAVGRRVRTIQTSRIISPGAWE